MGRHGRSSITRALAVAVFLPNLIAPAAAEEFPSKSIAVVIHTKYGGGTDLTARMMMVGAERALGVPMKVTAKRGGSGAKAHSYVDSRPRDGYTIMALTQTHLYTIARGKSDLKIEDLVGIARAMDDPTFVAVSAKSPYTSFQDLLSAGREKALNWSVAQIGGTEHIGLARLADATGMKYRAVPFGSGGEMVQGLMSGAIDAAVPNVSEAITQIQNGDMRPLLVLSENRLKDFPEVPSSYELGYRVKVSTTRGYAVLKGTPEDRIQRLSEALVAGMNTAEFAAYLKQNGLTVEDSVAGHEAWTAQIREEYAAAASALKALGLLD